MHDYMIFFYFIYSFSLIFIQTKDSCISLKLYQTEKIYSGKAENIPKWKIVKV